MNLNAMQTSIILHGISSGIYGVNTDGLCIFINQEVLNLLGYDEDEVLYTHQHLLFHHSKIDYTKYEESDCPIFMTLKDKKTRHCEEYFIKKDGSFICVSLSVSIMSDGNAVVVFQDLSQQKAYETELKIQLEKENTKSKHLDALLNQQSKLATLGEMINNIAHQWKQPLNSISTSISGLKVKLDYEMITNNDILEVYTEIMNSIHFMTQTIEDFKNFTRPNITKENFNISEAIESVLKIISASFINHGIEIKKNLDNSIMYFGSKSLFQQVILNILVNAKDALIENNIPNKIVEIKLLREDNFVHIHIIDNAQGITPHIQNKIFEQYFTTKDISKGTGIGLYMSKQIIENEFNGSISTTNIDNIYGKGAIFDISLLAI